MEKLASVPNRPLLLVNAQWQPGQVSHEGSELSFQETKEWVVEMILNLINEYVVQVISDFGFGARKKSREDLVSTFEVVYFIKRSRILGEDVCLMRRYPSDWQVLTQPIHLLCFSKCNGGSL